MDYQRYLKDSSADEADSLTSHEADGQLHQLMKFEVDENEYGFAANSGASGTQRKRIIDVQFQPSQFGILDKYQPIKEIYKVMLSPTIITLASNKETNQVRFTFDLAPYLLIFLDRDKEVDPEE